MKNNELSRRVFIRKGAAAFAAMSLAGFSASALVPAESKHLAIGLIGCGHRGTGIAGLLKGLGEMQLAGCCDILVENLNKAMAMAPAGAVAFTDYKRLLEDNRIDAVIIAVPLYLHYEIAMAALQAGKHVYLEKTMTYSIAEALQLEKQVGGGKLVFQVGHQYRYFGLYHKVKEMISQNWLGTITRLDCQYHNNTDWRFAAGDPKLERLVNWRMYREYSGGLMAELCSHQVDIANWMLDSTPLKVTGLGSINYYKDGRECFDSINVIYQYPKGINATFSSLLTNSHNGYTIRIMGTKAALEISRDKIFLYPEPAKTRGTLDGVSGATIMASPGEGKLIGYELPGNKMLADPTAAALMDFAKCVSHGSMPFSNVHTGKDTSIAIHMANQAMESGSCQYWKQNY